MGIELELARAAAYEQLKGIFEQEDFNKRNFPSVYARDWRLCYEVLEAKGQLYDLVRVLQKQAAKLIYVLLNAESTLEVYGASSEPYKASLIDTEKEHTILKSLIQERMVMAPEPMPEKEIVAIIKLKDGRRVRQIEIIMTAIKELGYDPKKIPDEGKGKIREICESKDLALFSKSSFDNAWKSKLGQELFCTVDKERFKKR